MSVTGKVKSLVDIEPELYPAAVYLARASFIFPVHLSQVVEAFTRFIETELKGLKRPPHTTRVI